MERSFSLKLSHLTRENRHAETEACSALVDPWRELGPQSGASNIHVTPDGRSYVYTFVRRREDLYLVDGFR